MEAQLVSGQEQCRKIIRL